MNKVDFGRWKSIQLIVLIPVLLFTLNIFFKTPLEVFFNQFQVGFFVFLLFFVFAYFGIKLIKRTSLDKNVVFFLFISVLIPIWSAYKAEIEFGQPLLYGLLAERRWLLVYAGIWIYHVLITRKIDFRSLEVAFLFMAWGSLLIFLFFVFTFDPSQLSNYDDAKMIRLTEGRGVRFMFQNYFIIFGVIYYFINYLSQKKTKYIVYMLLFLGYILFAQQGRMVIISLTSIFLLYFWNTYSLNKFIIIIIKSILFIAIALMFVQIIEPDFIEKTLFMFFQMFEVLSGNESLDPSANARIYESAMVLNYFRAHPESIWLGVGRLSGQWNEGFFSVFGHFYVADIGFLGGIFVYGIFGFILLCLFPFYLSIKYLKKVEAENYVFIAAIQYFLIYELIGFINGNSFFGAIEYILLFFVLLAYSKLQNTTLHRSGNEK